MSKPSCIFSAKAEYCFGTLAVHSGMLMCGKVVRKKIDNIPHTHVNLLDLMVACYRKILSS